MLVNPFWFGFGIGVVALLAIQVIMLIAYGMHVAMKKGVENETAKEID